MAVFKEMSGNIFNSTADAVVVTVNCVGFMGKGMALECALRYPEAEASYKRLCERQGVQIGAINWLPGAHAQHLALFPTKDDYKFPSKLGYIESGLTALVADCSSRELATLALPRLGAELGGLDWTQVLPLVRTAFDASHMTVELWTYSPDEPDPVIGQLLDRLTEDPESAIEQTGITEQQISLLARSAEYASPAGATDLLKIPGIGKVTVRKLIQWANQAPSKQSTLFD